MVAEVASWLFEVEGGEVLFVGGEAVVDAGVDGRVSVSEVHPRGLASGLPEALGDIVGADGREDGLYMLGAGDLAAGLGRVGRSSGECCVEVA